MKKMFFNDVEISDKTAVSVRDGVQEYYGAEIGQEPYDKLFKVYRSAETIRKISDKLKGLPVTDGHVELETISDDKKLGNIVDSKVIDNLDETTKTTILIENNILFNKDIVQLGKTELSLGYYADMKPHDIYDFEQKDIIPHHLAIVKSGRCGKKCKIKDEGIMNFEELLKAIKALSPEDLVKIKEELGVATPTKTKDGTEELVQQVINKIGTDAFTKLLQNALNVENAENVEDFKDSKAFKDAVMKMADVRVETILKAKNFLDAKYDFSQGTTKIMHDAVATMSDEKFTDEEIGVAFKMLKQKQKDYSKFGDEMGNQSAWLNLDEIEGV